jgi:hypothetical protein
MNSTKKGLYIVDIGSDDGSRLAVDGTLVYTSFVDQGYAVRPRMLMSLTGTSSLVLDYYENAGGNQLSFQNLPWSWQTPYRQVPHKAFVQTVQVSP